MSLQHANLNNLKSLWHSYGATLLSDDSNAQLYQHRHWPYRCWLEGDVDTSTFSRYLQQACGDAMIPILSSQQSPLETYLQQQGWHCALEQTAMVLPLATEVAETGTEQNNLTAQQIDTARDIDHWCAIGSSAFGYRIDRDVISRLVSDSHSRLILANIKDTPVACALLHKTGNTIGLHQFGVAPKYQSQGIAHHFMQKLITDAINWQGKQLVLQASEAGLPLYKRLGFEPQFSIRSYQKQG